MNVQMSHVQLPQEVTDEQIDVYTDDISGAILPVDLVVKARAEEIGIPETRNVQERMPATEMCLERREGCYGTT